MAKKKALKKQVKKTTKKKVLKKPVKKTAKKKILKKQAKKSGNKTVPVDRDPADVLAMVRDERKRKDCEVILEMMKKVTGKPPVVWGGTIIGFGLYHYKYAGGRQGEFMITGFSPRAQNIVLYIMSGFRGESDLMEKLGKHKTGKSCLYITRLDDINLEALEKLLTRSVEYMRERYETD